jgi:hypothetical protein
MKIYNKYFIWKVEAKCKSMRSSNQMSKERQIQHFKNGHCDNEGQLKVYFLMSKDKKKQISYTFELFFTFPSVNY